MKSLADALPPEIAEQIHPAWRANEAAYWIEREQLLSQFAGQWIAFADGHVIAFASTPLEVFLAIQQSNQHPFVIRVGFEREPMHRIRSLNRVDGTRGFALQCLDRKRANSFCQPTGDARTPGFIRPSGSVLDHLRCGGNFLGA